MEETEWDPREVKQLKKKRLVQNNLMMLILFLLFVYYIQAGGPAAALLPFLAVFLWILTARMLYTTITGKPLGTKTNQVIQAFDKQKKGKRSWKLRTGAEAVFTGAASILLTAVIIFMDFDDSPLRASAIFPFAGSWVGYNIGEMFRINNIQEND
ncbi:hypothetical protein C6Y45_15615 [Alkalicoccus saliphilus]|uniref:Uncharacterized protein n=2 Tax=Alkalicoccus saliphilus TaxID=200989 RepID=A0A2T4U2G8_9BACI|nr:hypothetical protein C6Y45_15615 [Alkalicoccus saliphilus]